MTDYWTLKIETDPETGEGLIQLPDDIIKKLDLREGDELIWTVIGHGAAVFKKREMTKL